MRPSSRSRIIACAVLGLILAGAAAGRADERPDWAYPMGPPPGPGAAAAPAPQHVPDSQQSFTPAQIADLYGVPDWHPGDHSAMPDVVAHGRKPAVAACGYCHLPNGLGRPENAGLAGLPAAYLQQQMSDYRSGARGTALPGRVPASLMIKASQQATEAEIADAIRYFATLPPHGWVRVTETETVPATRVVTWARIPAETGREPIGERIIELPEDAHLFGLRDARSGFIAYVPPGSIAKGEALVARGSEGGAPCATCHGQDLRGLGPIPGIAGRSPTYIVRQLYEFQHGIRAGAWSALMAPQVKALTVPDMVAIAAYAASRDP